MEGIIKEKAVVSLMLVFVFVTGAFAEDQIFVGENKDGKTEVTTEKPKDWRTPKYRHVETKGERRRKPEGEFMQGPIGRIYLGPGHNQSFSPGTVSK
jgi:hypothetical protein